MPIVNMKSMSEKGTQMDKKTLVRDIGLNSDNIKKIGEIEVREKKVANSKKTEAIKVLEYDPLPKKLQQK